MADRGCYTGFDTEENLALAELLNQYIPCAEGVRYRNSGTEATLLLFRLMRAYTGRDLIIRIDGHFHGSTDYVIPNNLAGKIDVHNLGGRVSVMHPTEGIPYEIANTIRIIPWNDLEALNHVLTTEGENIAGLIMNPIDFNNGCITTTAEYLSETVKLLHAHGSLLAFDEVLSGFKTGISCAQGFYGVTPALCSLSKALSNGVPISAAAGRMDIMSLVMDPDRDFMAGGTYSGNQLGVHAAIAALNAYSREGFYNEMLGNANYFFEKIQDIFKQWSFPAKIQSLGCMFGIYFGTVDPETSYRQLGELDWELARKFFTRCISSGLYFHTDFTVSSAHTRKDLDTALIKMYVIVRSLA